MRFLSIAVLGIAASVVYAGSTTAPQTAPKPAPEFVISMPDDSQKLLSSFRGKVIALEFLYTTCPHCQHASQVFTQLHKEFGSRGFEPVGVAFNDQDFHGAAGGLVTTFIMSFGVSYPVGYSERAKVLDFLGFSPYERFVVPQIVWIDRKGYIRSKTPPLGDESMLKESYWREMIEKLTSEPPAASRHSSGKRPLHTAAK